MEFSFSASGWLMQYQLGVAYALQRHGIGAADSARFVGASGGAAVSAALALDVDAKLVGDFMVRCCADYHRDPMRNMWRMRDYAESCVRRCMHERVHEEEALRSGKLNVQVSLLPSCRGVIISDFHSAEYYCSVVMASCTMSPVAGMPFQLRSQDPALDGVWVFDGGLTAILPRLSAQTVTVCPLHFLDADIKPSRYVPLHWAVFPPSVEEFKELFWLGAHDGMAWLHARGMGSLSDALPDPRAAVSALRGERVAMRAVWRLKPLQARRAVSSQRSLDGGETARAEAAAATQAAEEAAAADAAELTARMPASNAHVLALLRQRQQRQPPNVRERVRARAQSWSSSGSESDATLDSFSSARVESLIARDGAKAGPAMTWPREAVSRVKDSVAVAAAVTCVKPLALGVVYAELWSRAALSAATAAAAAVESRRRAARESSGGWLSVRRWVHDGMLGTAGDSWTAAANFAGAAVDPAGILQHVPLLGSRLVQNPEASKERLHKHSFAYRYLARAALV